MIDHLTNSERRESIIHFGTEGVINFIFSKYARHFQSVVCDFEKTFLCNWTRTSSHTGQMRYLTKLVIQQKSHWPPPANWQAAWLGIFFSSQNQFVEKITTPQMCFLLRLNSFWLWDSGECPKFIILDEFLNIFKIGQNSHF